MIDLKNKIIYISLILFIIDLFVKTLAFNYLTNVTLIPGFLSLTYAKNEGAAFSILWGNRWFIILITVLILIFLICNVLKERSKIKKYLSLYDLIYGLLFGGILGNLFDRLLRGYVIDYISLNLFGYCFPIFNIADIAITIGVILMCIYILFFEKSNKNK